MSKCITQFCKESLIVFQWNLRRDIGQVKMSILSAFGIMFNSGTYFHDALKNRQDYTKNCNVMD